MANKIENEDGDNSQYGINQEGDAQAALNSDPMMAAFRQAATANPEAVEPDLEDSDDDSEPSPKAQQVSSPSSSPTSQFPSLAGMGASDQDSKLKAYQDALSQANQAQNWGAIQKGTNAMLAGAVAGTGAKLDLNPANEALDEATKAAQAKANMLPLVNKFGTELTTGQLDQQKLAKGNIDLQNDIQKSDPNSEVSQLYRKVLLQAGMKPDSIGNVSAATIEKAMPGIEHMMTAQQHNELMAIQRSQINSMRDMNMQNKLSEQDKKHLETAQKAIDAQTKKLKDTDSAIESAKGVLYEAATNPTAANALATHLARIASGGQRINTVEMAAFGGSKALGDRLNQIIQTGTKGTMSPDNIKYAQQYLDAIENANNKAYQTTVDPVVKRFVQNSGSKMNYDDAYSNLTGKAPPSAAPASTANPAAPVQNAQVAKPKTVTQNGHVYTLNEATGKYE